MTRPPDAGVTIASTAEPSTRALLALALVAAATLLLEVTLVRLISVALWYPVAYAALACAMLGLGAAAVAASVWQRLARVRTARLLPGAALLLAASTALGYPLWNAIPADPLCLGNEPWQLVFVPAWLLLLTLPFACAGLFVARMFATWPACAARLYAADLVGASLGVISYVGLVTRLGAPSCLLASAACAALGGVLAAPSERRLGRVAVLVSLGCLLAVPAIDTLVQLRISRHKAGGTGLATLRPRLWTVGSAIDVVREPHETDATLLIDGGTAQSQVANPAWPRLRGLRRLPYRLTSGTKTLVIGSGGGAEVQAALEAGSRRILALEIDSGINEIMRGELAVGSGNVFLRPEVELVTAEARAYLAAHDEQFDAVVSLHTISNAASTTGALALAENYLLTVEALRLLLLHVAPEGVLLISRPESQLGRLTAMLALAWPFSSPLAQHLAVVTAGTMRPAFLAALVVSRVPLDAVKLAALHDENRGRLAYEPDGGGDSQEFFAAALRGQSDTHLLGYRAMTLEPATDERPFFNLTKRWSELDRGDFATTLTSGSEGRNRLEDLPMGQVAVVSLLAALLALASLLVILPAALFARRRESWRHVLGLGGAFGALGAGYMMVEVVLVQRLVRVLGEPQTAMIAVLGVLLAASGFGSWWLAGRRRMGPALGCLGAALAAVLTGYAVPLGMDAIAARPYAWRLIGVVAMVAPIGILLGVPFAAALARLERPNLVAWAWAQNSLFAVAGTQAALVISSGVGLRDTALAAAACYAGVGLTALGLTPRKPPGVAHRT